MITLRNEATQEEIRSRKAHLLLGRAEDCDLRFDEQTVSAHHAEIRFDGRWYMLTPRSAKNGVYVRSHSEDAILERPYRLRRGDRFTLGRPGPVVRVDFVYDQQRFERAYGAAASENAQLLAPLIIAVVVVLLGTMLVLVLAAVLFFLG